MPPFRSHPSYTAVGADLVQVVNEVSSRAAAGRCSVRVETEWRLVCSGWGGGRGRASPRANESNTGSRHRRSRHAARDCMCVVRKPLGKPVYCNVRRLSRLSSQHNVQAATFIVLKKMKTTNKRQARHRRRQPGVPSLFLGPRPRGHARPPHARGVWLYNLQRSYDHTTIESLKAIVYQVQEVQ